MCTAAHYHSEHDSASSAERNIWADAILQEDAQQDLLRHLGNCLDCLFAIAKQREPLAKSGCAQFKALLATASPLFDTLESPLGTIHLSEDTIENYHFRRLTPVENKVFEAHIKLCPDCARKLHDHRMFIYALQAALATEVPLHRDRNGATFQAVAIASASGRA